MDLEEEKTERQTFKTLGQVFEQARRMLEASADGLRGLADEPRVPQRERLMFRTLAEARLRAARHLAAFREDNQKELDRAFLQYTGLLDKADEVTDELRRGMSEGNAIGLISRLDQCLSEALEALSQSYSPPLESCEKASALVAHLRRASSAIMNGARDL